MDYGQKSFVKNILFFWSCLLTCEGFGGFFRGGGDGGSFLRWIPPSTLMACLPTRTWRQKNGFPPFQFGVLLHPAVWQASITHIFTHSWLCVKALSDIFSLLSFHPGNFWTVPFEQAFLIWDIITKCCVGNSPRVNGV